MPPFLTMKDLIISARREQLDFRANEMGRWSNTLPEAWRKPHTSRQGALLEGVERAAALHEDGLQDVVGDERGDHGAP
jgi:hypothetical protein